MPDSVDSPFCSRIESLCAWSPSQGRLLCGVQISRLLFQLNSTQLKPQAASTCCWCKLPCSLDAAQESYAPWRWGGYKAWNPRTPSKCGKPRRWEGRMMPQYACFSLFVFRAQSVCFLCLQACSAAMSARKLCWVSHILCCLCFTLSALFSGQLCAAFLSAEF